MSAEMTGRRQQAPSVQGLELFEQYEASGHLLLVTSDASALRLQSGDFIVRRPWATSAEAVEVNRSMGRRTS